MEKTWKPTAAGVCCIISGVVDVIFGLMNLSMGSFAGGLFMGWFASFGVPFIVLGAIAIIGGIFALKRTRWVLALVGAICALFGLGILAIIFLIMGKEEFA